MQRLRQRQIKPPQILPIIQHVNVKDNLREQFHETLEEIMKTQGNSMRIVPLRRFGDELSIYEFKQIQNKYSHQQHLEQSKYDQFKEKLTSESALRCFYSKLTQIKDQITSNTHKEPVNANFFQWSDLERIEEALSWSGQKLEAIEQESHTNEYKKVEVVETAKPEIIYKAHTIKFGEVKADEQNQILDRFVFNRASRRKLVKGFNTLQMHQVFLQLLAKQTVIISSLKQDSLLDFKYKQPTRQHCSLHDSKTIGALSSLSDGILLNSQSKTQQIVAEDETIKYDEESIPQNSNNAKK